MLFVNTGQRTPLSVKGGYPSKKVLKSRKTDNVSP